MPNALLKYDPIRAPTLKKETVETLLAPMFLNGLAGALHDIVGIPMDDVELEVAEFGHRLTLQGGVILPVGLTVRALRRKNWLGTFVMPDKSELLKPQAVAQLACDYTVLELAESAFAYLGFDIKVENGAGGGYWTSHKALVSLQKNT